MQSTLSTLQTVQAERTAAVPEAVVEPAPLSAWLEGFRRRNAALDAFFYDVSVVSGDEAAAISPWLAWEGSILFVPPTGTGRIAVCHSTDALAAAGDVRGLAVAGVGSSALGSAAFARNVADALGAPVAAVVSGYGLSDLVTEALGGWFLFGSANSGRQLVRLIDDAIGPQPAVHSVTDAILRKSEDTAAVIALLSDPRFRFDLVIGHSKGNLVLSEALYALVEAAAPLPIPTDTRIVTLSAVIEMPRAFTNIIDVMGAWDWFGRINSRTGIPIDVSVPRAGHHTNHEVPFHLPVRETLTEVLSAS